jgi:hypothetical protein
MTYKPDQVAPATRRQVARQARDAFPRMGVYTIRDNETGAVLVGASRNVDGALNRTQFELRMRSHANKTLQAAWDRGGSERFTFEIAALIKENDDPGFDYLMELRLLEQLYREEFERTALAG